MKTAFIFFTFIILLIHTTIQPMENKSDKKSLPIADATTTHKYTITAACTELNYSKDQETLSKRESKQSDDLEEQLTAFTIATGKKLAHILGQHSKLLNNSGNICAITFNVNRDKVAEKALQNSKKH